MAKIKGQIGQLANQGGERERGKFPSQPVPNPKGQYIIGKSSTPIYGQEDIQAITTLKYGKQVDNQVTRLEEEEESQDKPAGEVGLDIVILNVEDRSKKYVPKAPYPERLIAPKKSSKYDDISEVFKHVQCCTNLIVLANCTSHL